MPALEDQASNETSLNTAAKLKALQVATMTSGGAMTDSDSDDEDRILLSNVKNRTKMNLSNVVDAVMDSDGDQDVSSSQTSTKTPSQHVSSQKSDDEEKEAVVKEKDGALDAEDGSDEGDAPLNSVKSSKLVFDKNIFDAESSDEEERKEEAGDKNETENSYKGLGDVLFSSQITIKVIL